MAFRRRPSPRSLPGSTRHASLPRTDSPRARLELPLGAAIIGIVATLRSWKGHPHLIDAFASLKCDDALLLIVGDGGQRAVLEDRVASLGLAAHVGFASDQADVLRWLHAMDALVLPSCANECVPQALQQAMLSGLPCITTAVGSIGEVTKDQVTALIIPAQDTMRLTAAMVRLLEDADLRRGLGDEARAHCAQGYGLKTMPDRMEQVFLHAIAAARAS